MKDRVKILVFTQNLFHNDDKIGKIYYKHNGFDILMPDLLVAAESTD